MGFVSSIILICLFGFISHFLYRKYGIHKGKLAWIFYYSFSVIGFFLIIDSLAYLGMCEFMIDILNLIPWTSIENGKDMMWNSFQLVGIDWNININQQGLDYVAILLMCSYPVWFKFFKDISRKMFGGNKRRPYEKGFSFLISKRQEIDGNKEKIKKPHKV